MTNAVITWNTTVAPGGFQFRVYTIAYQTSGETLKTGILPTRAQAVGAAKRWTRQLKATQRAAVAA